MKRLRSFVKALIAPVLGTIMIIGVLALIVTWGLHRPDWLAAATANGAGNVFFLPFTIMITAAVASWQVRLQLRAQAELDRQHTLEQKSEQARFYLDDARREIRSNIRYLRMLENYFWNGPGRNADTEAAAASSYGVATAIIPGLKLGSAERALQGEVRPYLPVGRDGHSVAEDLEQAHQATLEASVRLARIVQEVAMAKTLSKDKLSSYYNGAQYFFNVEPEFRDLSLFVVRYALKNAAKAAFALGVGEEQLGREADFNPTLPQFRYLIYLNQEFR